MCAIFLKVSPIKVYLPERERERERERESERQRERQVERERGRQTEVETEQRGKERQNTPIDRERLESGKKSADVCICN